MSTSMNLVGKICGKLKLDVLDSNDESHRTVLNSDVLIFRYLGPNFWRNLRRVWDRICSKEHENAAFRAEICCSTPSKEHCVFL